MIKVKFLDGFNKGWDVVKQLSRERSTLEPSGYAGGVDAHQMCEFLELRIEKHPVNFGLGLGLFVGLLRFSPRTFLTNWAGTYAEGVTILRKKPQFYRIVKQIILGDWNRGIKKNKKRLTRHQISDYEEFLKAVK